MNITTSSSRDHDISNVNTTKNKRKQKETKSKIPYKLLPKKVYVFQTQVLSPLVNLIENNVLMIEEYQWLCDIQ